MGLPEPHHQARLGDHLALAQLAGQPQHAAGAAELRAPAGDGIQAGHDLDVVVEDVGPLGDHLRERHLLALEVGGQDLDQAPRCLPADLADHAHEGARPLVGQVVAVDRGDDRVAQPHARDRARHAGRLERVVPGRPAGLDVAEAAPAGAGVAEDHEGGRTPFPALADVRTGGLLADRVQPLRADQLAQPPVALAAGGGDFEPRRLALPQRAHLGPEDAHHVHPAGVRPRAGRAHAATAGRVARPRRPGAASKTSHRPSTSSPRKLLDRGRAGAQLPLQRGHLHALQSAGIDPAERLEVVGDVDGESVRGHARAARAPRSRRSCAPRPTRRCSRVRPRHGRGRPARPARARSRSRPPASARRRPRRRPRRSDRR